MRLGKKTKTKVVVTHFKIWFGFRKEERGRRTGKRRRRRRRGRGRKGEKEQEREEEEGK